MEPAPRFTPRIAHVSSADREFVSRICTEMTLSLMLHREIHSVGNRRREDRRCIRSVTSTYVIYGGSGGIGSAIARLLHEQGAQLHLVGRNESRLKKLAKELSAEFIVGDVADDKLFARVAEAVTQPLDGLAYAVGSLNLVSLRRLTSADALADLRLNAVGAALAVQAALPAFRSSSRVASAVLFSSVAVTQGFPMHTSVAMAKGAVEGLTVSLAAELAPKVRVNAIAPSLTRTPLTSTILSSEDQASSLAGLHPLQRLGTPEDIAELAAFLLSERAGWITGQVIAVDGGRSTIRHRG